MRKAGLCINWYAAPTYWSLHDGVVTEKIVSDPIYLSSLWLQGLLHWG